MGNKISGKQTADIVRQGISLVPEGRQLFPYLSVSSNLNLGASLRRDRGEINKSLQEVYKLFPILLDRSKQNAGTLSGGEQQMLAIGRGLMANPKLLCMDEPSLGLAPIVIEQLGDIIKDINKKGVSILLVEQNVHLALDIASKCYVLQVGRVVLEGDTNTIKNSDVVKRAYLGA
jgi:branched-chain amino acid transport system ATP-binding protein